MAKKKNQAFDESVDNFAQNTEETAKKASKRDKNGTENTQGTQSVDNSKYKYVVKNKKARSEIKQRKAVFIIAIILALIALSGGLVYGFYSAITINNFSIFVENDGMKILSLSPTENFLPGTQLLEINGPSKMDNTSIYDSPVGDTPIEDRLLNIVMGEGQQSEETDKYIAASFYLKNTTSDVQYFNEYLKFVECTKGIEKALRIMLVKDYDMVVYGHLSKDGTPEKVVPTNKSTYPKLSITSDEKGEYLLTKDASDQPWYCEPFYDSEYAFYNKGFALSPNETCKYSIIIWLEGWDPECVNDILGGKLRIEFAFETVLEPEKDTNTN